MTPDVSDSIEPAPAPASPLTEKQPRPDRLARLIVPFACVLFLIALVRNAWMADDAYIGLRTVDNAVNGYGLTWNTNERVQAYTAPLWILMLTGVYTVTREPYYTSLILSLVLSAGLLPLLLWAGRTSWHVLLSLAVLVSSKAFMDYAACGLENPVSHLLLAAFCCAFLRTPAVHLFYLSLLGSLAVVNRMDLALLVGPALIFAWFQQRPRWRGLLAILLGATPFVLWELFALFYYGFPFPNTAYAKMNTGIDRLDLIQQGSLYFLNSLRWDPVTLPAIAASLTVSFWMRDGRLGSLAVGIILYLVYVLSIGGDFMSGRFFTAPLVVAVFLLARVEVPRLPALVPLGACAALALSFLGTQAPLLSGDTFGESAEDRNRGQFSLDHGISDERAFYYPATGLLHRPGNPPNIWFAERGVWARENGVRLTEGRPFGPSDRDWSKWHLGAIGIFGYYAGPDCYIVDPGALTDALLARLPPGKREKAKVRIGHLSRHLPDGYLASLETGEDRLSDRNLGQYYDKLALITRGPLFSGERLREIWRMNTGQYDDLIDRDYYRNAAPCEWVP
jgi:arabinofuranosyltransferase